MTFRGDGGAKPAHRLPMLSEPTRALRMGYDFARGVANVEEPVLLACRRPSAIPRKHRRQAHIKIIGMQPYDLKEGPQHWTTSSMMSPGRISIGCGASRPISPTTRSWRA